MGDVNEIRGGLVNWTGVGKMEILPENVFV